jgi:hypothetical protein
MNMMTFIESIAGFWNMFFLLTPSFFRGVETSTTNQIGDPRAAKLPPGCVPTSYGRSGISPHRVGSPLGVFQKSSRWDPGNQVGHSVVPKKMGDFFNIDQKNGLFQYITTGYH